MRYLSFDLRALALLRMCIATVLIIDLSIRLTDLEAFYTNTGAVPLSMLFEHSWNRYAISFHTISGLWIVQLFLFLWAGVCAFLLLIGYRTRLFTFLSWLLLLSLHNRNPFILQGGDDLLRMVLFWGMFIPWGMRYSCDRLLQGTPDLPVPPTISSLATFAYLLQICYIYTGSALLKGPEWDTDFTALYYAYSLDQIAYPVTKYLYYYPELLKNLTRMAYYFELLVPLLFFVPLRHGWFRLAGVAAIAMFHLLNACTLFIGLFPLIGVVTVTGLLPSFVMDKLDRRMARMKIAVAHSFLGISFLAKKIIRWKNPVYIYPAYRENARNAVLVFLILFVLDWNFSNLASVNSKLSDNLRFIGYGLRLDQSWGMFAPGVFKDDGWYIFEGETAAGQHIDLLHPDEPLHYRKPEQVVYMFKNDRWRKYSENFIFNDHTFLRGYYCNFHKRKWNEDHPDDPLKALRIIYMTEFTLPDYQYSVPKKNLLWECID